VKTDGLLSKTTQGDVKTRLPRYVHRKIARGRTYYYFDTGQRGPKGKRLFAPLPNPGTRAFDRELERVRLARWRRETAAMPSMATKPADFGEFSVALLNAPQTGDDLYFIRAGDAVKIGRAFNVWKRMQNMQVNNHLELNCICRLAGRGHEEAGWHAYFKAQHIRGEWFHWTPAIQASIELARKGEPWWEA
jgi:hypothetical protein